MPQEEIVFTHTVEGLFLRALGPKLNPKFKAKLREAGLDLDQKLQSFYPRSMWAKLVDIGAKEGFPGETPERAYELLGQRLVHGYSDTLFGKAVLAMIRLLGPKRTLARMTST